MAIHELSLTHVASWLGKTEQEHIRSMLVSIGAGRLMEILSIEAQANLGDWIERNDCINGKKFVVSVFMSMRRKKDVVLYCLCQMDFGGKEPLLRAEISPGLDGIMPRSMIGCPVFKVGMDDLEAFNDKRM